MDLLIFISLAFSFIVALIMIPYAIKYFRFVKLVTADVHKKDKPLIPNSAGVPLVVGILGGLLLFTFLKVFLFGDTSYLLSLFAAMISILIIMFSGFLDDINSLQKIVGGVMEGKSGLNTWKKPLLTIPAAIPLMAIMSGTTVTTVPFIGAVDFGILYPLILVPIGVVGAANMINMLGGFNGLEAGMGIVYTLSLGIFALIHGEMVAAMILLSAFSSLLAVFVYNFYPAKILPGDSLTYVLGAVVASGAIIGNMEKAAIIVMIPFFIQAALKFYSRVKTGKFASDLGILHKDGSISSKYGKRIYSWTHLLMNLGRFTERKIVLSMILVQVVFASIPFLGVI